MSEAESQSAGDHGAQPGSPPGGSSNAEAGPSEPYPRGPALPIEELSRDELDSIIASKRHHKPHKTLFCKNRQASGQAAGEEGVDGAQEPPVVDDMVSERWIREDARRREEETRAAQEGRTSLKIKKGDREWDFAYDESDGEEEGDHPHGGALQSEDGYVWDVLFENQRGIYIFGKPHFSSNSLLPLDPSAFTVPLTPPKTSDITMSRSSSRASKPRSKARPRRPGGDPSGDARTKAANTAPLRKTIDTAYTPETYQLPSPEWTWVTPWLVNMRDGTDEAGWRYNAWFRRTKWKSHAGPAGWAGWVRRREWVRLRQAVGQGSDPAPEDSSPKKAGRAAPNFDLRELFRDKEDPGLNLDRLVRAMSRPHLDRERLDAWKEWLGEADWRQKLALTEVLSSLDGAEQQLRSSFVYGSSYELLLDILHDQNILRKPEKPPSPDPSKAMPQECYLHDHSPADTPTTKPYDV